MTTKSLLLGNGFNRCLGVDTSYKNICAEMQKISFVRKVLEPIDELEKFQYNLEKIINHKSGIEKEIIEYFLFAAIIKISNKTISNQEELAIFFNEFDFFFTTNYDPLLYRKLLKHIDKKTVANQEAIKITQTLNSSTFQEQELGKCTITNLSGVLHDLFKDDEKFAKMKRSDYSEMLRDIREETRIQHISDGFIESSSAKTKELIWDKNAYLTQNLFYLHGALHIYKDGNTVKKYTKRGFGNDFIKGLQKHSSENFERLSAVFEHDIQDKTNKIENNSYLSFCLESLKKLEGSLTVIGWSCSENDHHILEAINESNVDEIIFYYHTKKPEKSLFKIKNVEFIKNDGLQFLKKSTRKAKA